MSGRPSAAKLRASAFAVLCEEALFDHLRPVRLTCESLTNPLGLDEAAPRLGWALDGEGRDRAQTAYEIRVATSPSALAGTDALVWHVACRQSSETLDHAYAGEVLRPGTRYWWTLRAWDEAGRPSGFAAPAWFETGLMGGEWAADWIAGPRAPRRFFRRAKDRLYRNPYRALPVALLRSGFRVERPVARARLYATALGIYEARINGRPVGDGLLAPGWTDYAKRLDYQTYDVTTLVELGDNVLGVLLGEGWYSGYLGFYPHRPRRIYGRQPQIRARLVLGFEDGIEVVVATDDGWRAGWGSRLYSDLLKGEWRDARLAATGWDRPGFDVAAWSAARVGKGTRAILKAQRSQPARVTRDLEPVTVTRAPDGGWIFDLGQNMAGRVRLDVSGLRAGQRLTLRHAEMLTPEGALYTANLRSAKAEDVYVAGASREETWEPLFTIHGFRYVSLSGFEREPPLSLLRGRVVNSDLPETATLETSSPALNQLWSNILWSQRGNFLSIPTDCPQRDERLGWMADIQVFLPTAAINMDVRAFMAKWMDDVLDAQSPKGAFSDVSPRGPHNFDGAPAWGDAGVIVPVTLYRLYRDRRLLERCYPAMARWTALIARNNPDGLRTRGCGWNFGDWLSAGETTSKPLVATAYWALVLRLMAEAADVLGRKADRQAYEAEFARIAAAFRSRFLADDGMLEGDTQTAYLLALAAGLLPKERVAEAVRRLVANIERHDTRIATGFLGVRHILPILTQHGHVDLAYRLVLDTRYPSWLYAVAQGATTVWERWDGYTPSKGFQNPRMNSFNHYTLGSVGEWLMNTMAGIVVPGGAGRTFDLAPLPGAGVDWCSASQLTPLGRLSAEWRRGSHGIDYSFDVPANTSALVTLPCRPGSRLSRDGSLAEPDRFATHNGLRHAVMAVGSGSHHFSVAAPVENDPPPVP